MTQQIIKKLKQNNIVCGQKDDKIIIYFIGNYSNQDNLKYYEILLETNDIHYIVKMKYRKHGRILNHYAYVPKKNGITYLIEYILALKDYVFTETEIIDDEMKLYMNNLYNELKKLGYNVKIDNSYRITIYILDKKIKIKIERHDLQSLDYFYLLQIKLNDEIVDYLQIKKKNIIDWLKKYIQKLY